MIRRVHKRPRRYLFVAQREDCSERLQLGRPEKAEEDGHPSGRSGGQNLPGQVASAASSRDPSRSRGSAGWMIRSESAQRSRPPFRMSTERPAEQHCGSKSKRFGWWKCGWQTGLQVRPTSGPVATRYGPGAISDDIRRPLFRRLQRRGLGLLDGRFRPPIPE